MPFTEKEIIKNEKKTDIFNPDYKLDNTTTCKKYYETSMNINIYDNTVKII